jgi:hypothetical protein
MSHSQSTQQQMQLNEDLGGAINGIISSKGSLNSQLYLSQAAI